MPRDTQLLNRLSRKKVGSGVMWMNYSLNDMWPELPYDKWEETLDTLHMWMQIIGKIKLKLAPFLNQWWEVAFQVTAHGMTTGIIPYRDKIFQVDFDFLKHKLTFQNNGDWKEVIPLKDRSVAEFYQLVMETLGKNGIRVEIWPTPVEVQNPIPFNRDTVHSTYNKEYVERWWRVITNSCIVFDRFRSTFRGKSSPIQFFWGSFDLNGTRFSGKKLPDRTDWPKGYEFMRYAENEENFAFGFWPGDKQYPHAVFYSYLYPQPAGLETTVFAYRSSFNEQLKECILPYTTARKAKNPEKSIMHFLESTYEEWAKLAGWDMGSLCTEIPVIR